MSSLFDPEQFLNEPVSGEMSTRTNPTPLGRYEMTVEKAPVFKQIIAPDGADWESFVTMELECTVSGNANDQTGQPVKNTTGKDKNFARFSCKVDRTPAGKLDKSEGKNVALGRLRAACGQNNPAVEWKPADLLGARFSGEIKHRQDKNDATKIYAEVHNPIPL